MSKKVALPLRIAPLQRVVAEPITDSGELAAFDKARKRAKRLSRGKMNRTGAKSTSGSTTKKKR